MCVISVGVCTFIDSFDIETIEVEKNERSGDLYYLSSLSGITGQNGFKLLFSDIDSLKGFFIAIGIQRTKGLEWESLDGSSVRLVFMIGGPEDRQNEYLKILSKLTNIIKDEEIRKSLIAAETKEEVLKILKKKETILKAF